MIVLSKTIRHPVHVSYEIPSRQPVFSRILHVTQGVLTAAKVAPEINITKPVVTKKKFSELPKSPISPVGTECATVNDWSGGLEDVRVVRRMQRKHAPERAHT